jgi:hypothetical protein
MKAIMAFAALALGTVFYWATEAQAQWTVKPSGTGLVLRGVSFTDASAGTVVGQDGIILRTTDAGETWVSQSSGTTETLNGVSFADASTGTAVGYGGIILRTTDGGATWRSQTSGTTLGLRDVSFVDANTGTAVGHEGTILHTTTGGGTGNPPPQGAGLVVYDDTLASPWINASWSATVAFDSEAPTFSGAAAIRVAQNAWGALRLHSGPWGSPQDLNPANYASLDFAVHGGTQGLSLGVNLENDLGQSFPVVQNIAVAANGWTVLSFPMSQLNPNNQVIHRLVIRDLSGQSRTFSLDEIRFAPALQATRLARADQIPSAFRLGQNYPNPFNPATTIRFELAEPAQVTLSVYNLLGQEVVRLLDNAPFAAGFHQVRWDGRNTDGRPTVSGVYLYRLQAGVFVASRKMLLLK